MINKNYELTIDDLIVEYMIYKVINGYEPSFTSREFMLFLQFFKIKMNVQFKEENYEEMFPNFLYRKKLNDWYSYKEEFEPHMDLIYSEKEKDFILKANYKLSNYDKSVLNTYFMDDGMGQFDDYHGKTYEVRKIIEKYLSSKEKRKIDETKEVTDVELQVGRGIAMEIITSVWNDHIKKLMHQNMWPMQCTDIQKYLFEIDLASIINVPSIKDDLIKMYDILTKRIAVLYNQDKNLQISTNARNYLAKANFDFIIKDYEKIINSAYNNKKNSMIRVLKK